MSGHHCHRDLVTATEQLAAAQARIAAIEDQLNAYKNALRVHRQAEELVLMREQEWAQDRYVVIDGGALTGALEFSKDLSVDNRDNLRADVRLAQARIAELTGAVNRYGKHDRDCPQTMRNVVIPYTAGFLDPCNCGLDAALTAPDFALGERWKAMERVIDAVGAYERHFTECEPCMDGDPCEIGGTLGGDISRAWDALATLDKVT